MFRKTQSRTPTLAAATATAAAFLAFGAGAAFASSVTDGPATRSDVGSFVYDQNGTEIGSWQGMQGRRAILWIGAFDTPGNYLTTVPMRALSVEAGRVVLNEASSRLTTAR
ncbi:hypothetical protein [Acidisphaera rubrifaciens]|uniref:PRC-barrel domain-containing protein n=1 Tax=Acidisphaera rubrifaciens HS-AP3 TaxID=1231350 RepID=A0A0D6P2T4_9PROT|nr:hypothetical protein [Acidisphaera rubrifaciens]GAN75982.1 hypothetical protein Asru_0037_04 [Acidisphaera rubrifaciens HS-AP3]